MSIVLIFILQSDIISFINYKGNNLWEKQSRNNKKGDTSMFCMNCGQKLPDNAKFCSACGEKILDKSEYADKVIVESQIQSISGQKPIVFTLKGNTLSFEQGYQEYTEKRLAFFNDFLRYFVKERKILRDKLDEGTDYDKKVDEICNLGNRAFDECVHRGHSFLLSEGVYSISEESLYQQCGNITANGGFAKHYGELEEGYLEIVATDEQMKEYRRRVKASRGYWQGGGFGVTGAIKGAVTAGAMNAVGGVFHGIGDFISSEIDSYRINIQKREFLASKDWEAQCSEGLIADAGAIFDCVYSIYAKDKDIHMPHLDFAKKEIYRSNAEAMKTDKAEYFKLYAMALQEYPFSRDDYWRLLYETDIADHEVLQMMEYFLPIPFLMVSAAINKPLNKRLGQMDENTYDDLDKKIAYLDQSIMAIEREASTSTSCKAFLKDYRASVDEFREQLMKKRLTADDGEEFSSKDELNQYLTDRKKYEEYRRSDKECQAIDEHLSTLNQYKSQISSPRVRMRFSADEERINFFIKSDASIAAALEKLSTDDYERGVDELQLLAEHGICEAQYQLGHIYDYGIVGKLGYDRAKALKWYMLAAEQGHHKAQCAVGFMYENGRGVPPDYNKAKEYYEKAMEQGNTAATNNLAVMYYRGTGVKQDYTKALELFKKATSSESGGPENWIAGMYMSGKGVPQDYSIAAEWYLKSAEKGLSISQYRIGNLYENGIGVEQDYKKAMEWYLKAADQSNPEAEAEIGSMYDLGLGVVQNYEEARKWYLRAQLKNNPLALNNLALLYESGRGGKKDHKEAIRLLNRAIDNGSEEAKQNLKVIKKFWE